MTNEEIKQTIEPLIHNLEVEEGRGFEIRGPLLGAVRGLVAQAYEEATQILERLEKAVDDAEGSLPPGESYGFVPTRIADARKELRALADTLVQETISS